MLKIRCLKCDHLVKEDKSRTIGCLCDPDSPAWCAISAGRVLAGSHSSWEKVDD